MSWTRAWALALLGVPALLLVLAVATFRWKSRVAAALGGPGVMARLHDPFTGRLQRVKALLSLLGMSFLILSWRGPAGARNSRMSADGALTSSSPSTFPPACWPKTSHPTG
ncbi:MAG: hypothetical protein IPH91_09520 [Elusimicrobia bacterium]|nr:hypothetical protein [Elusimicrobiota bacterium]